MIRFVIQRHEQDHNSGMDVRTLHTLDIEIPALEAMLRQGGRGEMGFEVWQLLGVELVESNAKIIDQSSLPYWEPCNPGCDPDMNGARSKFCVCAQAHAAMGKGGA